MHTISDVLEFGLDLTLTWFKLYFIYIKYNIIYNNTVFPVSYRHLLDLNSGLLAYEYMKLHITAYNQDRFHCVDEFVQCINYLLLSRPHLKAVM